MMADSVMYLLEWGFMASNVLSLDPQGPSVGP